MDGAGHDGAPGGRRHVRQGLFLADANSSLLLHRRSHQPLAHAG